MRPFGIRGSISVLGRVEYPGSFQYKSGFEATYFVHFRLHSNVPANERFAAAARNAEMERAHISDRTRAGKSSEFRAFAPTQLHSRVLPQCDKFKQSTTAGEMAEWFKAHAWKACVL